MSIHARAPLRISFAGGGTDVPPFPQKEGGCVLSATISMYAYGSLHPRTDGQIGIESLDLGITENYAPGAELLYDGKLDLIKAAVLKLEGQASGGFDLFLHTDAPPGSGLGSSSALMVTLVGLLREFKKIPLMDYEIARLAWVIERQELGIKGGLQDQYAATFGGFNFIEFFEDRVVVNPLRISEDVRCELEHNLLLYYTGQTRLSAKIIEDQSSRYEQGEEETLSGLRELKSITIEMKNLLLRRELDEFGALLHVAWENKKKLSPKISSPEIEAMYEEARSAGALGGKVSGAGGGGYMLFYCPFEKKHKVAKRLMRLGGSITDFRFAPYGLQTWRVNSG